MNVRRVGAAAAVAALAFASACERDAPSRPTAAPAPADQREVDPETARSSVRGRVRFEGEAPQPTVIRMNADPYCANANAAGAAQARDVETSADGGLAGVFVHISHGLEAYRFAAPGEPVVLDQRACMYSPRVFGIQSGQSLELRNSDDTLHNVHAVARGGDGFNVGMPTRGSILQRKFQTPHVFVRIKCDVHPWMAAYAGVVAHPFHAVTAEDGSYTIAGLPAGTYTVDAAHPTLGVQRAQVVVADQTSADADFSFSK